MYKIYADGQLLWMPGEADRVLINPVLDTVMGYSGELSFQITQTNPFYNLLSDRKTMLSVYRDNTEMWYGELREHPISGISGLRECRAVGCMSFLGDSIQPQGEFHNQTVRGFLEHLVSEHNAQVEARKQFVVGIVTVTDSNNSLYRYTNYETTLECIRDKLVDRLGGHLKVRHTNGTLYLDYVTTEDYGKLCEQSIDFGKNLLEYAEEMSADDVITCLIPLGAKLEESEIDALEQYTTIKSVNDGKDYIFNQTAVNTFGWVRRTETWDDVTVPANLLAKGRNYLESKQFEEIKISLKAVDLSCLGITDTIDTGDRVKCNADPFGMHTEFPLMKRTYNLASPGIDSFELANSRTVSYTESIHQINRTMKAEVNERLIDFNHKVSESRGKLEQLILGGVGGYKVSEYNDDGVWVRDLIMNQPKKEDATQMLVISPGGIAGIKDGQIKSAIGIDGTIYGQAIEAESIDVAKFSQSCVNSLKLWSGSTEYNDYLKTSLDVSENKIMSEVSSGTTEKMYDGSLILGASETTGYNTSKFTRDGTGLISAIETYNGRKCMQIRSNAVGSYKNVKIYQSVDVEKASYLHTIHIYKNDGNDPDPIPVTLKIGDDSFDLDIIPNEWNCFSSEITYTESKTIEISITCRTGRADASMGNSCLRISEWKLMKKISDIQNEKIALIQQTVDGIESEVSEKIRGIPEELLVNTNFADHFSYWDKQNEVITVWYVNDSGRYPKLEAERINGDFILSQDLGKLLKGRYKFGLDAYTDTGTDTILLEISQDKESDGFENHTHEFTITNERNFQEFEFTATDHTTCTFRFVRKSANNKLYIRKISLFSLDATTYTGSKIQQLKDEIKLTVTQDNLTSVFSQKANEIYMSAMHIKWNSDNTSMSEDGTLTCGNTSGYWMKLQNGKLIGGYQNDDYGFIDSSASLVNIDDGTLHHGLHMNSDVLDLRLNSLYVLNGRSTSATSVMAKSANVKLCNNVNLWENDDGTISWSAGFYTLKFIHGILVGVE